MNFDVSLTLIVSVEYKSFSAGVELSSLDLYSWFVANRKSDVVVVVVDVVDVVRSENVLFRRHHLFRIMSEILGLIEQLKGSHGVRWKPYLVKH